MGYQEVSGEDLLTTVYHSFGISKSNNLWFIVELDRATPVADRRRKNSSGLPAMYEFVRFSILPDVRVDS